jgi:formate-dependent nitrite reductase cytochrome c552 subunit
MNIIDSKTTDELLRSLLAEAAKSQNELRCAQADLRKAQGRLQFVIAIVNQMLDRLEENQDETKSTSS